MARTSAATNWRKNWGADGIIQGYNAQTALEGRRAGVEESLPVKLRIGGIHPDRKGGKEIPP